jgi:hypothetical protein
MAEMRVTIEGSYNPATGTTTTAIPISGSITTTPSGTQTVTGTVTTIPNNGTAVTSLSAATAVSTGTVYDLGYLSRDYTFVGTSSATLTAGVVRLFGSIDNTNFVQIGTDITASTDFPSATSKAYSGSTDYRYFRADITTLITGGNITVKVLGA